jgi:nicotinate-nucleotide adenylyltransferase
MLAIFYGGTFDPVHEGHLAIARAVVATFDHEIRLLPSADPPHRAAPGASGEQRARMLDLAVAGDPRLLVDRRELHRQGPSFTVDTLLEVRRELGPSAAIVWVLGIDALVRLNTWHRWRQIFELAHVLGVERPGTATDKSWLQRRAPYVYAEILPRWRESGDLASAPCGYFAALPIRPLRAESATEVRKRIGSGQPWKELVPAAVASYIREHGLYRSAQTL